MSVTRRFGSITIVLERGDITRCSDEAIVNAANTHLAVGGGVCGAIHRAGGPAIAAECHAYVSGVGSVPVGGAVATTAGALPASYVIHAVGPVWHGGASGEPEALTRAYVESIRRADELGLVAVAFPSISTGIYGYPVDSAAGVALRAVHEGLSRAAKTRQARFVLFDEATYRAYERALDSM